MSTSSQELQFQARLKHWVRTLPLVMAALERVRRMQLQSWAIGAGVIRSLVWDELHGFEVPTHIPDWDFVYYDANASQATDQWIRQQLQEVCPDVKWDVVNQAQVHHWLSRHLGREIKPFPDLVSAIASWPETATCVAVTMDDEGEIHVLAPHDLVDLFAMEVRKNSQCLDPHAFDYRRKSKQWQVQWPNLRWIDDCPSI